MSKTRSPQNLAKMLAYVLGRRPDEFGLIPDADGFVKIKDLLKALHEEAGWGYVNESHLREVLITIPVPAFEIDAHRIRARQRETPAAESGPEPPPKLLYAHVRRRAYPWVHANGIHPSSHPQVVLAAQRELAERLGRRIDPDPVILTVNVHAAEVQGVTLTRFGDELFLADRIPVGCFSGPALPEAPAETARIAKQLDRRADRSATPGSFSMDLEKAAGSQVPESLKRTTRKGRKIDPKRLKREQWSREKPPWKKN
jgi:putative RNA 2'-phosphotransferase